MYFLFLHFNLTISELSFVVSYIYKQTILSWSNTIDFNHSPSKSSDFKIEQTFMICRKPFFGWTCDIEKEIIYNEYQEVKILFANKLMKIHICTLI